MTEIRDHWRWRPGWAQGRRFWTFHVTWQDVPEVQEHMAKARARLAGVPGLDLVPGEWLHLTTQGIGFDGEPIPEEKQLGMLGILVLGGLDTTRGAIGNIVYRVAANPGTEDRLRDPAWVRRDLDEFLRLDSPVSCMARVATRDVELNGAHIKAGERVQVRYDSANRDESKFRDADTLVFDEPRSGHAAFGFGVHRCIGSNLARLQIEIAFDELLKQVKNLRLAPGAEIVWMPGNTNALHAVNLEFDRAG